MNEALVFGEGTRPSYGPKKNGIALAHYSIRRSLMKLATRAAGESGAIGYMLLWLMGIPASVLFLVFLMRGCT